MREIKYRQQLPDGAWHYWGFFDGHFKDPYLNEGVQDAQKNSQQNTGLTDKNGKDIYEGDVVRFDGHTHEDKFVAAIEFKDGMFCDSLYHREIGKYREVIGNIYENPELLNESTKEQE